MYEEADFNKKVDARVLKVVQTYLKTSAFTDRKLTDTPTDANQVVPRKFITANGVTADRPGSPVDAQPYFDTTQGFPIWFYNGNWVDAQGNTV